MLLNMGVGFTVTTTFSPVLLHPLAVVIYTYVTGMGAVVVLVSVSLTFVIPMEAPSKIPATAARLHANVAPAVALVAVYVKVVPLQIAGGVNVLLRDGSGLTTTITFCPALLHPLAVVI